MTKPLRFALLGCGAGPRRHHLPILARFPEVELVAVADPDPAGRAEAMRLAPGAEPLADWREAVALPNVDAVVVSLPSALHASAASAALQRGLHVYVEKPMATTLADAERIVAAWRHAGVVGMTGFNYRFNALYRSAREILVSGRLGELVAARTVFTIADGELPGWRQARAQGGGALLDLGSHHLDLALWLFQEPVVEVAAQIRSRRSEHDTALVELRLASGLTIQSLFAYGAIDEERFEVYGRAGKLIVDRGRHQDAVLEAPTRRWSRVRRSTRVVRDVARARYVLEKRLAPGHEPSHRAALAHFVGAARTGMPARPDLEDGRACIAVLEAAERSAASGRTELVAPVSPAVAEPSHA